MKMAKFEAPGVKEYDFMMVWIFKKQICTETVDGEQGIAPQQHFP